MRTAYDGLLLSWEPHDRPSKGIAEARATCTWSVYCSLIDVVSPHFVEQANRLVAVASGVVSTRDDAISKRHIFLSTKTSHFSNLGNAFHCHRRPVRVRQSRLVVHRSPRTPRFLLLHHMSAGLRSAIRSLDWHHQVRDLMDWQSLKLEAYDR
jgi:uncharacterized membrane protein